MAIPIDYQIIPLTDLDAISNLKEHWLASLTRPQDGMWASFRDGAKYWGIQSDNLFIGYACANEQQQLLQFYVLPKYLPQGISLFEQFIELTNIKHGVVGTNNPVFLSLALHFAQSVEVHTYLFNDHFKVTLADRDGHLHQCSPSDLERVVDFCHYSIGAPKEWLHQYIGGLIEKEEVFTFENASETIGTCEVRKSISDPRFTDIGMIVSPDHRKKGYGTYLLHKAKTIALDQGQTPICSCEKENIGSLKSIHNCGFRSIHQLLTFNFK